MKDKEQRVRHKHFELLYDLQFQRTLHPFYILFTKIGVIYTLFVIYMVYTGQGGLKLFLATIVVYWIIYRNFFDYRYYELERVWLFKIYFDFIGKRIKKPFE